MKYKLSYWEKTVFFDRTEIVVIGSGIVGLTAAIALKKKLPHKEVCIFERGVLPIGASVRNAGFACFGSVSEILSDSKKHGIDDSIALVARRLEGLTKLRELVSDAEMDYMQQGGYEVFTDDDQDIHRECIDFIPELNSLLRPITGEDQTYTSKNEQIKSFGFRSVENIIFNKAEGQLNPGLMIKKLEQIAESLGVRIFKGLDVAKLDDTRDGVEIETEYGWSVKAEKVVVATNGFTTKLLKGLDVRPVRNLVMVTHPVKQQMLNGCFHYQEGYYYFRNIGNRILVGGGRNLDFETEATAEFGINEMIRSSLVQLLRNIVSPNQHAEPDMWWSGILGIGKKKAPIIEWYSPNIATAVRMGGMGVAIGSLAGEDVANLVAKEYV